MIYLLKDIMCAAQNTDNIWSWIFMAPFQVKILCDSMIQGINLKIN